MPAKNMVVYAHWKKTDVKSKLIGHWIHKYGIGGNPNYIGCYNSFFFANGKFTYFDNFVGSNSADETFKIEGKYSASNQFCQLKEYIISIFHEVNISFKNKLILSKSYLLRH